jgi:type IV pilus assembly protein PilO
MTLDELKNLDPENIGEWPAPVKIALVLIVMAAIIFAGWHFDIQNLRVTIENEQRKEVEQIASLESKQRQAANLEALKVQMQEMQQSFGDMLRQLPNKTEVAGLLIDISQTGLAAGLEFELFKPAAEVPTEFYAELPIQITVVGNYHKFGEFISGIAALPRIVTTHDINIQKRSDTQSDMLVLQAIAKTYRALDEEEAN